jgi:hypothetical protein
MNILLFGAAAAMALLTGCASSNYVEVVSRKAIYDNGEGMQILAEKWGFSSNDVRHIEYIAVNRSQQPMCAQVFTDESRDDFRSKFDGSVVEPGGRQDLAIWAHASTGITLQKAFWRPREGRCLLEDRQATARSTHYMDQSGRDSGNTFFSIAQGVVSAASAATAQSASRPRTDFNAIAREAEASAKARDAAGAKMRADAQRRANDPAGRARAADSAQRPRTATQRSGAETERKPQSQSQSQRVASASTQGSATAGTARRQTQGKAEEKTDFLRAVAKGSRLRALTCPGGDRKIFATGTRPRPKPEVVPCIDLHYRARCDGSDVIITGVAGNFVGRAGCFGDTYAIEPKPQCNAERVKIEVVEARACNE